MGVGELTKVLRMVNRTNRNIVTGANNDRRVVLLLVTNERRTLTGVLGFVGDLEKKVRDLYSKVCRLEEEKYDWEVKIRKQDYEVRYSRTRTHASHTYSCDLIDIKLVMPVVCIIM